MKNNISLFALLVLVSVFSSCDMLGDHTKDFDTAGPYNLPPHDSKFITSIAYIHNEEIDAAHMASVRSENADIKSFAEKKVYETQTDRIEFLAQSRGLSVPSGFSSEYMGFRADWDALSGRAFDSVYIWHEYDVQKQILAVMDEELNSTSDETIINFIGQYRPYIVNHHSLAESITESYKRTSDTVNHL